MVDPARRALVFGLGATAVVACTGGRAPTGSRDPSPGDDTARSAPDPTDRTASTQRTSPADSVGPADPAEPIGPVEPRGSDEGTERDDRAAPPGRDEIVARHGHRTPTSWGFENLPGLVERTTGPGIVLTLDLCGGPNGSGLDRELVDLLVREAVPAVVFVNSRWIDTNPADLDRLAGLELVEIANHGTTHRPLSVDGRAAYGIGGTADVGAVHDEIAGNHERLRELTGRAPRWFRSGTAHYDDVAIDIVHELGEVPVGFDVNADGGATFTTTQVVAAMGAASAGSIVIAHANRPSASTGAGLAEAIPAARARGLAFHGLDPTITA